MALVSISKMSLRYRGPILFDQVDCQIELGQRIGLLGRNGAGKTSLMRMLGGQEEPDAGEIRFVPGFTSSILPQDVPDHLDGTAADVIRGAFDGQAADRGDGADTEWQRQHQLDQILSRMTLDGQAVFSTLSAGMKRRVLLARALVTQPDLLLLDEPTNHMDLEAILWLEDFLTRWRGAMMFVTHDRRFLQRLATRILEVERGHLFDWSCDYATFLTRKEAAVAAMIQQEKAFDKRLAEEEAWIRQGIKARRTRNEGRVRHLEEMRRQRQARQDANGQVGLKIADGLRSGNLVVDAKNVSFSYGSRTIVNRFSTRIMRGDKVGVIGPNGAGKTTLLNILLGRLQPQEGSVRHGTNQQVAYFDQLREQLDESKTIAENVGDGSDTIECNGSKQHVIGYLRQFLFTPEQARQPIRFLSGGERNRILLARLFARPANVIVLDEPTNDLDIETLELLEQRLVEFGGTLLLVSHDRAFINNVVTSTIVFEPSGVHEYAGGYDDWIRCRKIEPDPNENGSRRTGGQRATDRRSERTTKEAEKAPTAKKKLTFREQQELDALPAAIERLESDLGELHAAMADPNFFRKPDTAITADTDRMNRLESELSAAYARWEELDNRT